MKRNLALVLCIELVLALFVGCASNEQPVQQQGAEPSGDGGAASGEASGTIDFRYWGAEQDEIMQQIANDFMAQNSNIKVTATLEPSDQFWTKILTSIAAKQPAADVCWINPTYAVQMMNNNQLECVQDLYDSGKVDRSKFVEGALQSYTGSDGKLYAVPKDFQTVCLIYNKGIFDEVGLPYPGDDYTWDQMVSDAQKLVKKEGDKITRYGFVHNASVMSSWFVYCYTNGGSLFKPEENGGKYVDTPENREAFQKAADLIFKYQVAPDGSVTTETTGDEMFMNEMVAMTAYVPAQIENYSKVLGDKVGVACFPYMKEKATITNCLGYGIPAGTKNLAAAKEFLAYLSSEAGQAPQSKAMIPAYKGIVSDMETKFKDMGFKTYLDAGDYAIPTPVEQYSGNAARKAIETEVSNILFGTKDVTTAIQDAEKGIIEAVEKAKSEMGS